MTNQNKYHAIAPENNGGKTHYYDLPLPDLEQMTRVIHLGLLEFASPDIIAERIQDLYPQTLNDLIEFKKMKPWQHEVMKACYAIDERAEKNGGSIVREVNKIIYYAERGRKLNKGEIK